MLKKFQSIFSRNFSRTQIVTFSFVAIWVSMTILGVTFWVSVTFWGVTILSWDSICCSQ